VKALEVRRERPALIHHAGLYVIDKLPDGRAARERQDPRPDGKRCRVIRWHAPMAAAPRRRFRSCCRTCRPRLRRVSGRRGPVDPRPGRTSTSTCHYTPTGTPTHDRFEARTLLREEGTAGRAPDLSFVQAPPVRLPTSSKARSTRPGAARKATRQRQPAEHPAVRGELQGGERPHVTEPVTLYGLTPHLHLRGKSMKYTLTWPDGQEEVFAGRAEVRFQLAVCTTSSKHRRDSAGSKVTVVTLFDNFAEESLQPVAGEGSVLVRAELGRDVRPAGADHSRKSGGSSADRRRRNCTVRMPKVTLLDSSGRN